MLDTTRPTGAVTLLFYLICIAGANAQLGGLMLGGGDTSGGGSSSGSGSSGGSSSSGIGALNLVGWETSDKHADC